MKYVRTFIIAALAFFATPALAQWQVPLNAVPIGRGGGVQGFGAVVGNPGNSSFPLVSQGASPPIYTPLGFGGGGTGATAQIGARNNMFPTPTRAGDVAYWNGSIWTTLPGNNSSTNCLQENVSGVPFWGGCGGAGGTPGGSSGQTQYNNAGSFGGYTMGGDATIVASTGVLTLASVIAGAGPIGTATTAPVITYDAKGRLTAVTTVTITPAVGSLTGMGANCPTWLGTPSSANLAACLTDETGTGVAVFGTAPTFTTSITNPLDIGGTATGQTKTFQTTTGVGSGDSFKWLLGNNGASEGMRMTQTGLGVGNCANPVVTFVAGGCGGNAGFEISAAATVTMQAYNRTGSAYATASFDAAQFLFRPNGLAAFGATTSGFTFTSASKLLFGTAAPTVVSGFCTSPSIVNSNGAASFTVNVGSACVGSVAVIGMPAANAGWACDFVDLTTSTNVPRQNATGSTITSVAITNYSWTTGIAANFTSSDVIQAKCLGY